MKAILKSPLLLFLLLLAGSLAAQTTIKDPVKYNDFIVEQQNTIGTEVIRFNEVVGADESLENRAGVDAQLKVMVDVTEKAIAKLKALKPIDKEFGLKTSALALFEFYLTIFQKEYAEMVAQLYADAPDFDKLQHILDDVTAREQVLDADFQDKQGKFAKHYGFELTENELQEQIETED